MNNDNETIDIADLKVDPTDRELLQLVFGKIKEWSCINAATCYLRGDCTCLLCDARPLFDYYGQVLGDHNHGCPWLVARKLGIIAKEERKIF